MGSLSILQPLNPESIDFELSTFHYYDLQSSLAVWLGSSS